MNGVCSRPRRIAASSGRTARATLTAFSLVLAVAPAWAHDVSFSYLDLVIGARAGEVRLTVHRHDAAAALGLSAADTLASAAAVDRLAPQLERVLAPRLAIRADGRDLPVLWSGADVRPERRAVEINGRVAWEHPPGRLAVSARLFPDNPLHETFVNVYTQGRLLRQEVLTDSKRAFEMFTTGSEGMWAVFVTFVRAGVHHIFIGPDHILFVIGLLLLGGGIGRILKITSGFTLAHSITLALATLGILQPPARVVEPLIALSIVYVGIDNLRARTRGGGRDGRAFVAFAFGLVHGFGFASVLTQLGLPHGALVTSLFAFNVGVELGQACIVLAAMPLLALLRARSPRLAPRALAMASWGVVLAGGWWFVERVWLGG